MNELKITSKSYDSEKIVFINPPEWHGSPKKLKQAGHRGSKKTSSPCDWSQPVLINF